MMMKKHLVKSTTLFALLVAMLMGACSNPFEAPETGNNAIPPEKGVVRIETNAGAARTLIPAVTFDHHVYTFTKGGQAADIAPTTAGGNTFELDPGTYTVTVKAFATGEATSLAAEGTSADFTITAGEALAEAVIVTLLPTDNEGQGTLAYTLTYPSDATVESFTLTRLAGESVYLTETNGSQNTMTGIDAGYYEARVSLYKGAVYAGKSEVVHIYKNMTTNLVWTFEENDFTAIPVLSSADEGPGTLREALANVESGGTIFIDLPEGDKVITLTSALEGISKDITIIGNGATLTQKDFEAGYDSQLLYVSYGTVKINRLHFKGGRAGSYGAAIYNGGNLTLESCIFSDNQTTEQYACGGAIYTWGGSLTLRGCTFYNNKAGTTDGSGGAIYCNSGTVTLTGNIFFGNTANEGNVILGDTVTSGGYNVSDHASGTDSATGSGYTGVTGDVFDVTVLPVGPVSFKPLENSAALDVLPNPLPVNYPVVDFHGVSIMAGGSSGAVQTRAEASAGYSLNYGVGMGTGTVEITEGTLNTEGLYSSGERVTLKARPGTDSQFAYWTIDGIAQDTQSPADQLTLNMDTHKTVWAVFGIALPAATALTVDIWANGDLAVDGAQWFSFTATAATQYIHFISGTLSDASVQLYDSLGLPVGSEESFNYPPYISRPVTLGAVYYIKVMPGISYGSGNYQIGFNSIFLPPPGATALVADTWTNRTLATGGAQWFSFTATADTQYIHFMSGTLTYVDVQLYDSAGDPVGTQDYLYSSQYISRSVTSGAVYYIKVMSYDGSGNYQIGFTAAPNTAAITVSFNTPGDQTISLSDATEAIDRSSNGTLTVTDSTAYDVTITNRAWYIGRSQLAGESGANVTLRARNYPAGTYSLSERVTLENGTVYSKTVTFTVVE
jgi:hypothetical protein